MPNRAKIENPQKSVEESEAKDGKEIILTRFPLPMLYVHLKNLTMKSFSYQANEEKAQPNVT